MKTPLAVLILIAIIVLIVINLNIYHKLFQVTYFNLGRGIFSEIFYAWIVSMLELGLIIAIGKLLFGAIFKILGVIGKIALVVLALALIVFIIWKIMQFVKGKANKEETNENNNELTQINQEMNGENEANWETRNSEVEDNNEGTEENGVLSGIELTEVGPNKVKIIKIVRDATNLSLSEVKDLVESMPPILIRVSKEDADIVKTQLESEGAKAALKVLPESETVAEKNNVHRVACVSCGKMINEDAKFCNFCGNKVVKTDISVCINCGNPIAANANFCHYCGERLRKDS